MLAQARVAKAFLFLFLFGFLYAALSVDAQAGPAYRRITTHNPASASWRDGIFLSIDTDYDACKKNYGNRWVAECQAPAPGKSGMRVEGMQMTPSAKGVWRWESETTMRFIPETHLSPDTTYTISLEKVSFPSRYSLNKNLIYRTQPQACQIVHETLWIDPSSKGQHVLSIPVHFIWPMNADLLQKNVSLRTATNDKSLRFGPMQFVWNDAHDDLMINVPILSLPAHNTGVTFTVEGLPGFTFQDGKRVIMQNQKGQKSAQASASLTITGIDRVMDVKNMVIEPLYDDNLGRGYKLVVTTSMQTKPIDVLNSLDLLLLPKKANEKASKDCNWEAMPALSAKDIEQSQKITATLMQPKDEPATEIALRLPVEAGRGVMCAMKTGLTSTSGYTLNRVRRFVRTVPTLDPEINFLQPGNILALRKGQKIDLHSVGVERIEWEVATVREPFLALAAAKTGFGQEEDTDLTQLTSLREGSVQIPKGKAGEAHFTALDVADLLGEQKSALFSLSVKGFVGDKQCCETQRLLLCSDLGMMLKTQANGSHMVFVRHIGNGDPVRGAEVRLLGANGVPVVSAKTDADGVCVLPSTFGLLREKKPTALVCEYEGGFGWLSLDDGSSLVRYGDFSVGGRHSADGGFIASVFTERGVYMPGETLHFGTIIRNQDWKPLGENLPVSAILYGPQGNELLKEKLTLGKDGLATLDWQSDALVPTGTYRLDVVLATSKNETSVLGSVTTRVEEFQPDTLALALEYEGKNPKGWIPLQNKAKIRVNLSTLYGEQAVGNRVKARFHVEPRPLSFAGFSDFTFCDTGTSGQSQDIELPDQVTDEKGSVVYELPLDSLGLSTQIGILEVEGFEKGGGRGVGRTFSHLFSPKRYVLGYKPENGATNLQYIPEGTRGQLRLLLLNENLEAVGLDGVKLVLSQAL